jgi:hypothetical protein
MKAKLITLAIGAAILGTGTAAMAHDWNDRHDDWRRHEWREREWRKHEWREHHHPRWHRDWYHYEPRVERQYVPVPVVPAPGYSSYPYDHGYDRDGVSIILRGHIN